MSDDDFALLAPHLELRSDRRGHIMFDREVATDRVWFPESGLGSIITSSPDGLRSENGLFGRDGFAPVSIIMGSDRSPHMAIVQVASECQVMPAAALLEAISASASLRAILLLYAQTLSVQTSYTGLSNAVHLVEERLARWLLMSQDRLDGTEVPLTHEYLSIMLSVRRPSITSALHGLEGNRLIRAERGCIIIRDRAGLEEFARDLYGVPEAEYERLIGPLR
ncbi:Crp/Fnr family transcriptional regulator [Croceibacterium mercuriale]|nr:Crp/Fnr family transcriptional regulator [Croceibacterium mercuriale]